MTPYPFLRPTAAVAGDALLPGDPKRAMDLASALMDRPLMSNLSRGLWGYHGHLADGRALTVQSTGIGASSTAVVVAELAGLGVRRVVRVGTCVALDPGLELGATLVVAAALPDDGVGAALGLADPVQPHGGLTASLVAATAPGIHGLVASTALFYDPQAARRRPAWRARGAIALDLSSASLLAVAAGAGVVGACALVVVESAAGQRLDDEAADAATLGLGRAAVGALAALDQEVGPEAVSP